MADNSIDFQIQWFKRGVWLHDRFATKPKGTTYTWCGPPGPGHVADRLFCVELWPTGGSDGYLRDIDIEWMRQWAVDNQGYSGTTLATLYRVKPHQIKPLLEYQIGLISGPKSPYEMGQCIARWRRKLVLQPEEVFNEFPQRLER